MSLGKLRQEVKTGKANVLVLGRGKRILRNIKLDKFGWKQKVDFPGGVIYVRD